MAGRWTRPIILPFPCALDIAGLPSGRKIHCSDPRRCGERTAFPVAACYPDIVSRHAKPADRLIDRVGL